MLASPLPPVGWPGAPLAALAVTSLPSRAMQGKHRPSRQAPAPQNPHGRLFMGSSEHRLCRGPAAGPGPVAPASLLGGRGTQTGRGRPGRGGGGRPPAGGSLGPGAAPQIGLSSRARDRPAERRSERRAAVLAVGALCLFVCLGSCTPAGKPLGCANGRADELYRGFLSFSQRF